MHAVVKTLELNTGAQVPVVGFGTWKLNGADAERACSEAFDAGYRHIDTAKMYQNVAEVGRAIAKCALARKEIFVTTKLWANAQGCDDAPVAIDESLRKLGLEYVDLYLIHWPVDSAKLRQETWKAMEEIYASGKAKAIGVSNYGEELLEEMSEYAKIVPSMNQIEVNPFVCDKSLIDYCHAHNIVVTNYKPLTRALQLGHPVIIEIAKEYGKTAAQVLLRWGIELGNVVIPKSSKSEHIKENIDIFDFKLSTEDMARLDELNQHESVVR